jgi:tetratricopeptide (TPR) repeat protein
MTLSSPRAAAHRFRTDAAQKAANEAHISQAFQLRPFLPPFVPATIEAMNIAGKASLIALVIVVAACNKPKEDPEALRAKIENAVDSAETRLRNHKIKDAEQILNFVLENEPEHVRGLGTMAKVRFAQANYAEAERLARAALDKDGDNHGLHMLYGDIVSQQGNLAEASKAYGKAVQLDSENSEYGLAYAVVLRKLNQESEAEALLRRIADIDPRSMTKEGKGVYTELADSLRTQGKLDDALKLYMKAQTTHASDRMAYAGEALVREAKADTKHALDAWSAYVRMDCCSEYSTTVAKKRILELQSAAPSPEETEGAGDDNVENNG